MAKNKKVVTVGDIKRERAPGGDIPESVMLYVAMHPELFQQYQTHERDVERITKMSRRDIQREDAEALAWLCWRARMVQGWTAVDRKPTMSWEAAVESAWLKDELFKLCSDRRKAFYAEREARRERLDSLVQTGALEPRTSTKKERKQAKAAEREQEAKDAAHSANTQEAALHEAEGQAQPIPQVA